MRVVGDACLSLPAPHRGDNPCGGIFDGRPRAPSPEARGIDGGGRWQAEQAFSERFVVGAQHAMGVCDLLGSAQRECFSPTLQQPAGSGVVARRSSCGYAVAML